MDTPPSPSSKMSTINTIDTQNPIAQKLDKYIEDHNRFPLKLAKPYYEIFDQCGENRLMYKGYLFVYTVSESQTAKNLHLVVISGNDIERWRTDALMKSYSVVRGVSKGARLIDGSSLFLENN